MKQHLRTNRQSSVWGTGTPRREFLYVDDFADACVFVLKNYSGSEFVNIGFGKDMTIAEFARYRGGGCRLPRQNRLRQLKTRRHSAKIPRRRAAFGHGLEAKVSLKQGLAKAYADFMTHPVRER